MIDSLPFMLFLHVKIQLGNCRVIDISWLKADRAPIYLAVWGMELILKISPREIMNSRASDAGIMRASKY